MPTTKTTYNTRGVSRTGPEGRLEDGSGPLEDVQIFIYDVLSHITRPNALEVTRTLREWEHE